MSSKRNKRHKRNMEIEADVPGSGFRQKLAETLELPKEIVLNMPRLTMVGNNDLVIENYKGIIEYEDSRVRINTGIGVVRITGDRLLIREITSEDVIISGVILSLEFLR